MRKDHTQRKDENQNPKLRLTQRRQTLSNPNTVKFSLRNHNKIN